MNDTISLSGFASSYGLHKGTVYRDCKRLGIDTSAGLSVADCDRLVEYYGLNESEDQPDPAGSLQVIQPGTQYLDAPAVPTAIDLTRWGFQPVQALQDPVAVAQSLIAAIDATEQGLDDYINQLQAQTQTTQQAASQLADRRRRFERKADKAEVLAALQQAQLTQAQQALAAEAAALGKSSAA